MVGQLGWSLVRFIRMKDFSYGPVLSLTLCKCTGFPNLAVLSHISPSKPLVVQLSLSNFQLGKIRLAGSSSSITSNESNCMHITYTVINCSRQCYTIISS